MVNKKYFEKLNEVNESFLTRVYTNTGVSIIEQESIRFLKSQLSDYKSFILRNLKETPDNLTVRRIIKKYDYSEKHFGDPENDDIYGIKIKFDKGLSKVILLYGIILRKVHEYQFLEDDVTMEIIHGKERIAVFDLGMLDFVDLQVGTKPTQFMSMNQNIYALFQPFLYSITGNYPKPLEINITGYQNCYKLMGFVVERNGNTISRYPMKFNMFFNTEEESMVQNINQDRGDLSAYR